MSNNLNKTIISTWSFLEIYEHILSHDVREHKIFGRDYKTIRKHINNALKEELKSIPTVANFATVQKEGERNVKLRSIKINAKKLIL